MILIDMPMPKTCGQCFCAMMDYDYNTVRCRFKYDLCFDANSRDYSNRRLDGCPLHEVQTDTDTISRQEAVKVLKSWVECLTTDCDDDCEHCHIQLDGINTVIEACAVAITELSQPDPDTVSRPQIHCKDCKYYIKPESYCDHLGITISDNDYCSMAKEGGAV